MGLTSDIVVPDPSEAEEMLRAAIAAIPAPDLSWEERAWKRLDSLLKPPRSLGRLEELAARLATLQRTERPSMSGKAIVIMAGDHGVTVEGVAPYPSEVTAAMVASFAAGGAAICQLARHVGAPLVLVDVGVASDYGDIPAVTRARIGNGTANMAEGPAMTREQALQAMAVGIQVADSLADSGVMVIASGEMGIGNSTAAAAVTAALTSRDPVEIAGPGTGLDSDGVALKAKVIARALAANPTSPDDPVGVLAALGGFELAGLAGLTIGAAARAVPVVADGFISGAATLAAVRLAPACSAYVFTSHRSCEPGHIAVLEALDVQPVLDLSLRLGEATGAALALSLMEAACEVMSGMATFEEAGLAEA